ncbi:MAG: NAD(P)-binding protein, partial [Chloroflexi bacterium]|nr:NAD(P)-binding protein [Chloroflexota bacterium]
MSRRAVIVGAGVGGLATASLLQRQGYDTLVLERTARPGGRCNVLEVDDFRFDTGPTLLLMPDVLDTFFAQVGRRRSDYLELLRSEPNYVVRYADGSSLEFTSDVAQMRRNLDALEPGAGDRYRAFLDDAGYKYRVARERFVERNFRRAGEFFTLGNLQLLVRTGTLGSLYRHVGRYFRDDRLR